MSSLDDDNLPEDLLSNIFKKLRINNPAHSRDLARLSQTNKKMKDAVRSRYGVYDPIAFHTIVNNPIIGRVARRYQLRFSEPLLSRFSATPLREQYMLSVTDPDDRTFNNLKRLIYGPRYPFHIDETGLVRRVARSNQTFRDDEARGGVEPLARIDLGIYDRRYKVVDRWISDYMGTRRDRVYRDGSYRPPHAQEDEDY